MTRNVLTIATGKELYIDLAINLARSFKWWHRASDIQFHIVTDRPELIPANISAFAKLIVVGENELPRGFSSKLYLDRLAPDGCTLFIDSDCLLFGSLDPVFDRFKGHSVSVVGSYISDGEWFGDIAKICHQFEVSCIPKFNGGIYYLEKGQTAETVYQFAREIEKRYDDIGFVRLRTRPNDEVIMALAMQLHGQEPVPDDGTIMSDPQACPGGYDINVISGKRWLLNPPLPDPLHQSWYPHEKVNPLVVHFLGYYTQHYPYRREVYRLQKAFGHNLNLLAEATARITIEYPERIQNSLKNGLRPMYRRIFGTREVKKSIRL